ncbi:MAG: TIGR00730 family Rossman fold protein [Marinilabiliales bacterium]|nr:TIGR00730 family Rossman fold protein [Marinilabiliales bacterium]
MNICVFSSSSNAIPEVYFQEARDLGRLIGQSGWHLVYGGANVGLMNCCAEEARAHGARTIGIIPELIHAHRLSNPHDHEQIITPNMRERKYLMRKRSDAFVALPGGFGTLEEILEVITLKQLSYHNKAIVFINTNGYYDHLIAQFEHAYQETFAKESYRQLYFIAANAEEAAAYLLHYLPGEPVAKWFKVPEKDSTSQD